MPSSEEILSQVIANLQIQVEYYKESAALWRLSFIEASTRIREFEKQIKQLDLLEGEVIY